MSKGSGSIHMRLDLPVFNSLKILGVPWRGLIFSKKSTNFAGSIEGTSRLGHRDIPIVKRLHLAVCHFDMCIK